MVQKTRGIALRAIKYGETSLVVTLFTADYGIQAFLVQGVRTSVASRNKAAYFQPGMLLDLVVYMQPNKNIQRLREYQAFHIYNSVHDNIVKNSIVLFSCEIMLRLLPEHAPLPELFAFAADYLIKVDTVPVSLAANLPLYFLVHCSTILGYEPRGEYSEETPHLDLQEGGFSAHTPVLAPFIADEDARVLNSFLQAEDYETVQQIQLNSDMRIRLIDWYITYLQQHTQHLGNIRSLQILRTILH
jgi:DNA repair protein RecO (recombination protein O)